MKLILAAALVGSLAFAASATEATVRLGNASVRFDRARWQASVSPDSISFSPQGKSARKLDPVELRVVSDELPCTALAEAAFQLGHYDTSNIEPTPTTLGGLGALRFVAHTGCRNATPRGVILCVKTGSGAYLLQALPGGCLGNNLFSGIDPLAEIAGGITFEAPR